MTDELDWLAARQPATAAPDPTATAAARGALLDHAEGHEWSAPPLPARRGGGRRLAARVAAISLATAAAVTVAAVGLPLGGSDGDGGPLKVATEHGGPLVPAIADAAPLKRLSARVAALPDQPGDATLAVHRNVFPDGRSFTGADLYLDDGTYYYAETPAGLKGVSGETPIDMPWGAIIAATRRATTLAPEPARAGFLRAAQFNASPAPAVAAEGKLQRVPTSPRLTLTQREDNMIWVTAIDVLTAGGSRADVRGGVLRLLATIPTVTLDDTTAAGGERLLRLRSADPRAGERYVETVYLDADTGVMTRFEGGIPGQRPDVVVSYAIERVEAADALGRR